MNRARHTVNFFVCLIFFTGVSLFSQAPVRQEKVTIKNLVGKAEIRSPESGKWREARVGMQVKVKWDIRTYMESSIDLLFETGTVLKLGENSVVSLSSLLKDQSSTATKSNIKVASGHIWANVKKLINKKSKFIFETPTALAAIRGTRLGIAVDKNKTVIDVYEGKVNVRNKGSRKEIVVTTRNRAVVRKGKPEIDLYKFDDKEAVKDSLSEEPSMPDTSSVDTAVSDTTIPDTVTVDTASIDKEKLDTLPEESLIIETDTVDLDLSIAHPENNSILNVSPVTVKGVTSPGAKIAVNSKQVQVKSNGTFSVSIDLIPGINRIEATSWLGSLSKNEAISVKYNPPKSLFLSVLQPNRDITIKEPIIIVEGLTNPGAEVTVNDKQVSVQKVDENSAKFIDKIPIPDEKGEFSVIIVSSFGGDEKEEERVVIYEPERENLDLKIISPSDGQVIGTGSVRLAGRAVSGAKIEVTAGDGNFTRNFIASENGSFTCDIPLSERDIGDYIIEVLASVDETGEEKEKSVSVEIDIKSPRVNTSIPHIEITGQAKGATKTGYFIVNATDQTPDDQITLNVEINGSSEGPFTLERSDQEKIYLEDGKNDYTIKAIDLAGHKSNVLSGEIYYLPGPLIIDVIEPDETQYNIDDLPPMPSNVGNIYMDIEVEIDDGIGDVPETIRYCRVNGSNLKESRDYIYTGKILVWDDNSGPFVKVTKQILIETEDIAGNLEKKYITISINE